MLPEKIEIVTPSQHLVVPQWDVARIPEYAFPRTLKYLKAVTPDEVHFKEGVLKILNTPSVLEHLVIDEVTPKLIDNMVEDPNHTVYVGVNMRDEVACTFTAVDTERRTKTGGEEQYVNMHGLLFGAVRWDLQRDEPRKIGDFPGLGRQMMELGLYHQYELTTTQYGRERLYHWIRIETGKGNWDRMVSLAISIGMTPRSGYPDMVTEVLGERESDFGGIEFHMTRVRWLEGRLRNEFELLRGLDVSPEDVSFFETRREKYTAFDKFLHELEWLRLRRRIDDLEGAHQGISDILR